MAKIGLRSRGKQSTQVEDNSAKKWKKKKNKGKKVVVVLILVVAAGAFFYVRQKNMAANVAAAGDRSVQTAIADRGDINSTLTSSGTLEAKDTYSITSLIDGEVLEANFEEGDMVEKGQVLYRIDSTSIQTQLDNAENSLKRAQEKYQDAQQEYQEVLGQYQSRSFSSSYAGYIKTLYVEAGDKVNTGTKIADVYSDSQMKLRLPFLREDAAQLAVGDEATVTLEETLETLSGRVTAINTMEEALAGGRLVRYVTIEVNNPGGLTSSTVATATVGEALSAASGTFEASVEKELYYQLDEGVTIEALALDEGDAVSVGQTIFTMTAESVNDILEKYEDTVEDNKDSVQQAENSLENVNDNLEDYVITAPISGQVVQKNTKVGDNAKSDSSNAMAVIYDLSSLTFSMSVDETEVSEVEVGQEVEILADAFSDESFSGVVTNVSLVSTSSQGVTNYPVTVTITEIKNLLPGMNVDGTIIVGSAKDVIRVPSGALQRGNRVYVKDDSVTELQPGAPAVGFRMVEVETGLISDDYVEIVSGIEEGDEVYVSESTESTSFNMFGGGMGGGMGGGPGGGM
ncbi:MAG: HlyD family efflux transporter periplasmic adaptor subunit, partial [bacterium]|nr:HlyD family efflux transporter periplasmic adaptor subunit [bacterium]